MRDGISGYLVDRNDSEDFAARVRQLILDPELREALGTAGQSHVLARFSVERLADDLDALYRELLE